MWPLNTSMRKIKTASNGFYGGYWFYTPRQLQVLTLQQPAPPRVSIGKHWSDPTHIQILMLLQIVAANIATVLRALVGKHNNFQPQSCSMKFEHVGSKPAPGVMQHSAQGLITNLRKFWYSTANQPRLLAGSQPVAR